MTEAFCDFSGRCPWVCLALFVYVAISNVQHECHGLALEASTFLLKSWQLQVGRVHMEFLLMRRCRVYYLIRIYE